MKKIIIAAKYIDMLLKLLKAPGAGILTNVADAAEQGKEFGELITNKVEKFKREIEDFIENQSLLLDSAEDGEEIKEKLSLILEQVQKKELGDYRHDAERTLDKLMKYGYSDESIHAHPTKPKCRKILKAILDKTFESLHEVNPDVDFETAQYSDIQELKEDVKEIKRAVVQQQTENTAGEEEPPKSAITDHNPLFLDKFKKHLFLYDEDSEDEETEEARLYQVFVKPQIVESKYDIITFLNRWLSGSSKKPRVFYGKPGIGKSTLTAFLVAVSERDADFWATLSPEEQTACDSLADHLAGRLHTLVLNQHVQTIDCNDAWRSVKQCFGDPDDAAYDNKILILDGLDEVCVLKQNFDGNMFLKHLSGVLTGFNFDHNVKILITSRSGYFEPLNHPDYLIERTIYWTSEEMQEWCRKYTQARMDLQENCACILREYNDLEVDDDRRDIFCVPIILYMCCHEGVRISEHSSVVGIYRAVFDKICKEKAYQRTPELDTSNEIQYRISWQFTKELAYQMYLYDKLETAIGSELVENAMNRTKVILCERYPDDTNLQYALKQVDSRQYFDKHFCIMHFQSGNTENGAEFAHKTVGEYFTAVKLYEDYFECVKDPKTTTEQVWRNIFEVFRYKRIPNDVLNFLVELTKKELGNPPEKLFEYYYKGMEEQLLWKVMDMPTVAEYPFLLGESLLPIQIINSFRQLTRFLSLMQFNNSKNDQIINCVFVSFLRYWNYGMVSVCCSDWILTNANFDFIFLDDADFSGAKCSGVSFTKASLKNIDLSSAVLRNCSFSGANLEGAVLCGSDLCGSDFSFANLSDAELDRANLSDAELIGAFLGTANLVDANLVDANLVGAELTGANLTGANLTHADLCDAKMTHSNYENLPDYVKNKFIYDFQEGTLQLR